MVKFLKGFSLAEAMISMLIITMVAIAAIPVLTKSRPQIESISLRGQYGCWYDRDEGKYKEWYFDERTPRYSATPQDADSVAGCILRLDQRPANFYILAAGAGYSDGSISIPAMVSAVWTPAISNELSIRIGRAGTDNVTTTVSNGGVVEDEITGDRTFVSGGSAEISAVGYKDYYSATGTKLSFKGLVPENISNCKLVSGPSEATGCDVKEIINHKYVTVGSETKIEYYSSYGVRINGCESFDESGNPDNGNIVMIENLTPIGNNNQLLFSNVGTQADVISAFSNTSSILYNLSSANSQKYNTNIQCVNSPANVEFSLEYGNSSYLAQNRLLGFSDNLQADWSTQDKSKMAKMIDMISPRRQTQLTKILSDLNPGAPGNDGAVLILW